MKKLFSLLLAIVCVFASVAMVGCKNNKYSYWDVKKLVASTDSNDVMTQVLEVTLGDTSITEFYINISNLSVDETTIGYVFGASSSLKKVTVTRGFLNTSDGWVRVKSAGVSRTLKITFTDAMRVNEIVFINDEDKVMEFEFSKYVIRPSFTSSQNQTHTKEDLELAGEKHNPLCAFDEQQNFDLSYARNAVDNAENLNKIEDSSSSN